MSFAQLVSVLKERNKAERLALECALFTLRNARKLHPMARRHMFTALKEILEHRDGTKN